MHTHKITWHILGTGAIGCLWASKFLQQAIPCVLLHRHTEDQEVTDKSVASKNFVPKPAVSKTLTITHLDKSQSQYKVPTQSIADTAEIRYLLVCTKSYQTQVAIESIQSRLSTAATIVLLQNGMGQQQLISERLPNHLIIAATTTEGALVNTAETTNIALENRLSISHTGAGVSYFGCLIENPALVPKVIYSLQAIGMQKDDNISRLLWQKLAINCVINPLTAIHNCRNGELLNDSQRLTQVERLSREVDSVINALSLFKDAANTLKNVLKVAAATANNYSSMQQDIQHGRKTEIDFINGYLQQQADKLAINTSFNQRVIADILQLTALNRV